MIEVPNNDADHYYPHVLGGARMATVCPANGDTHDCSEKAVPGKCAHGPDPLKSPMVNCAVTVLDRYTSSFHWTKTTSPRSGCVRNGTWSPTAC